MPSLGLAWPPGRRTAADTGSVTAELAVGMVSLVLVLGAVLGVVRAGQAQIACTDAARAAAREVARGADEDRVAQVVTRLAGPDARVTLGRDAEMVRVVVSRPVTLPLPGTPQALVRAVAVGVPETTGPGATPPGSSSGSSPGKSPRATDGVAP